MNFREASVSLIHLISFSQRSERLRCEIKIPKMLQHYLQDNETYDSISQISQDSTVASEFVEQQIKRYQEKLIQDSETPSRANSSDKVQVVNVHVDAVNIYGENESRGFTRRRKKL